MKSFQKYSWKTFNIGSGSLDREKNYNEISSHSWVGMTSQLRVCLLQDEWGWIPLNELIKCIHTQQSKSGHGESLAACFKTWIFLWSFWWMSFLQWNKQIFLEFTGKDCNQTVILKTYVCATIGKGQWITRICWSNADSIRNRVYQSSNLSSQKCPHFPKRRFWLKVERFLFSLLFYNFPTLEALWFH